MKLTFLIFLLLFNYGIHAQLPKVAFVLSGGGARGFAHVGVLQVLEEIGFKPVIITGTSMGSVIGGMYAIGYRSDSLKKIVESVDWNDVVFDKVKRENLNSIERDRYDRYVIRLDFEGKKFVSYSGFVKGTKVHNLLTNLCLPVSGINDFKKLPVAFSCIGTNIQNGDKVLLNRGSLPDAIRASMAIPSLFTSVELDGKILVDGGLTQNYPIQEARDLGADFIIGVDVGTKSTREELSSFVNIMMESMFLHGYQNFEEEKQWLNINIKPKLDGISPLDFDKADTIVKIGEAAARERYEELRQLYHQIYGNSQSKPIVTDTIRLNKRYKINRLDFSGLVNVSPIQVQSIVQRYEGQQLTSGEIKQLIDELYNTNLFHELQYQYLPAKDDGTLVVKVKENTRGEFDIGINYNSYHEASLLLGFQFRRAIFRGAILKADARLSSMPRLDVSYIYQSRFKPSFSLDASVNNIQQGLFIDGKRITTSYNVFASLYLRGKINISNKRYIGAGIGVENLSNRTDAFIALDRIEELTSTKFANNIHVFYRADSRDDMYIPTRGSKTLVDVYAANNTLVLKRTWVNALFRTEKHVRVSRRVNWSNYLNAGFNSDQWEAGNNQYLFTTGGMLDIRFRNYLPFAGLEFGQVVSNNILHYRTRPNYRLFHNNYISVIGDVAQTSNSIADMAKVNLMYSGGVGYEYRSPIGPIQFNVSRSSVNDGFSFFLNLGYWF
jgi:NTE family protein